MRSVCLLLLSAVCAFGAGDLSGRRAPGFSLPETGSKMHDLQDYRGKILIVDFMQVSCPHCVTFSAILEQAKAKYGEKIAVLSIVNPPSDQKGVTDYIAKNNIRSPTSPQITIPHVFLIDADGMIRNDFDFGPANAAIFEGKGLFAELDKMLAPKK